MPPHRKTVTNRFAGALNSLGYGAARLSALKKKSSSSGLFRVNTPHGYFERGACAIRNVNTTIWMHSLVSLFPTEGDQIRAVHMTIGRGSINGGTEFIAE